MRVPSLSLTPVPATYLNLFMLSVQERAKLQKRRYQKNTSELHVPLSTLTHPILAVLCPGSILPPRLPAQAGTGGMWVGVGWCPAISQAEGHSLLDGQAHWAVTSCFASYNAGLLFPLQSSKGNLPPRSSTLRFQKR